jgi:hypothetical protein
MATPLRVLSRTLSDPGPSSTAGSSSWASPSSTGSSQPRPRRWSDPPPAPPRRDATRCTSTRADRAAAAQVRKEVHTGQAICWGLCLCHTAMNFDKFSKPDVFINLFCQVEPARPSLHPRSPSWSLESEHCIARSPRCDPVSRPGSHLQQQRADGQGAGQSLITGLFAMSAMSLDGKAKK